MQSIDSINLTRFHHEELAGFVGEVLDVLTQCPQLGDLNQVQDLSVAYQCFNDALQMDLEKASEALFLADIDADNMALTTEAQLKICAKSQNDEKRHAALELLEMFIPFTGMTDLPYAEEYENYYKLLEKLDQVPQETRELLHITEWIERMHVHYDIMVSLMNQYQNNLQPFDPNATKRARKTLENAWYGFDLIANAIGAISPSRDVDDAIENINHIIQKYMSIVLAHHCDISNWEYADIDVSFQ
jgi:hypothetical protein